MDQQPRENLRAHYRLQYPKAARPKLKVDEREFDVMEISEGGAVILAGVRVFLEDEIITGVISFRNGDECAIDGLVVRVDEEQTTVRFATGVSIKQMLAEQIRLRNDFPTYYEAMKDADDTDPYKSS